METETKENLPEENIFRISLMSNKEIEEYLTVEEDEEPKLEELNKNRQKDCAVNITSGRETNKPSLSFRLFSTIDAGSVRGSIFNLAILSLGTACMALPQKFNQMSILVAVIDIFLAGVASYWTLYIMILASDKIKIYSYSKLVEKVYNKGLAIFLDVTILIHICGLIILFQVIAYKLVGGVVNEFGQYGYHSIDHFYQNSFWSKYYVKFPVMYGTAIFIILPLCLIKNISKMRFNSIFGIMSLIFITLIIVVQSPWYISNYWDNLYKEDIPSTHLNIWNVSSGFDENLYFFKGTATLFFAYSCHYGAFPVYKELKNNVLRRIQKVFFRSIVLDATIYTIVGLIGYLSAPLGTPDLIIERYKLFENDTVMAFGWIMFTFTLMMKIPANYNTLRLSIVGLIGFDGVEISDKINVMITIPTILFTTTIGCLYSEITSYIYLMGGFLAPIVAFIFPALLYIKTNEYKISDWKNVTTIVIVSILWIIGFISGVITIKGMFTHTV